MIGKIVGRIVTLGLPSAVFGTGMWGALNELSERESWLVGEKTSAFLVLVGFYVAVISLAVGGAALFEIVELRGSARRAKGLYIRIFTALSIGVIGSMCTVEVVYSIFTDEGDVMLIIASTLIAAISWRFVLNTPVEFGAEMER